jgi:hypothetical protein
VSTPVAPLGTVPKLRVGGSNPIGRFSASAFTFDPGHSRRRTSVRAVTRIVIWTIVCLIALAGLAWALREWGNLPSP